MPETLDDPFLKTVGQRIRAKRLKVKVKGRPLSQDALAAQVGIDRTWMSGIERGIRNVSLLTVRDIAEALGTKLSSLLPD